MQWKGKRQTFIMVSASIVVIFSWYSGRTSPDGVNRMGVITTPGHNVLIRMRSTPWEPAANVGLRTAQSNRKWYIPAAFVIPLTACKDGINSGECEEHTTYMFRSSVGDIAWDSDLRCDRAHVENCPSCQRPAFFHGCRFILQHGSDLFPHAHEYTPRIHIVQTIPLIERCFWCCRDFRFQYLSVKRCQQTASHQDGE